MGDLLGILPVRREVLHQPYLVKTLPPGSRRYLAGVPARDWGGGRCQSGVQGVAAMRGRAVTCHVPERCMHCTLLSESCIFNKYFQ